MRKKTRIGSYEIIWNNTTWRDWLPFTIAIVLLSSIVIGLILYNVV